MNKEPILEMKERLELCSDAVIKNTTIVTSDDIQQDYFLHVATKKLEEFIPYHSRIAAWSEDNTIPRIHVAPTLGGCIIATNQTEYLIREIIPLASLKKVDKKKTFEFPYLGGYYIHKIPFDVALKPNKKLVFDADETGEHWLITYNQETRKYPATIAGKVILSKLTFTPIVGSTPLTIATLVVEVTDKKGIQLDQKHFLSEGYWMFELTGNKLIDEVQEINKELFMEHKKLSASLLSFQEKPEFFGW